MEVIDVRVKKNSSHQIVIEKNILTKVGKLIHDLMGRPRIIVITDKRVKKLYEAKLLRSLNSSSLQNRVIAVPEGEPSKSLDTANWIFDQMLKYGADRKTIIVGFGGGVVTDLAGFVAATYMRGMPYLNMPTSVLGQLDASIGGKVSVNHPSVKNLIGSFYYPKAVYIDPLVLRTLPKREINSGLAEAIKTAIIDSPAFFNFIDKNYQKLLNHDIESLSKVVTESAKIKMKLVKKDFYEEDLNRSLNFGHCVGHVLEALLGYREIRHGEAVSIGMAVATRIALRKSICDQVTHDRILGLLRKVGLPTSANGVSSAQVWKSMRIIRMIRGGSMRVVLPIRVGSIFIMDDISKDDITACLFE